MTTPASITPKRANTINLGAGPSCLPAAVLAEASAGLIDYDNSGMGVTEISHRSKAFDSLLKESGANFRRLLEIPDNYAVLWMQGGGLTQFSATAQNLEAWYRIKNEFTKPKIPAAYLVTGGWSSKAAAEAKRLGLEVSVVADSRKLSSDAKTFGAIPSEPANFNWPAEDQDKPAFIYYCANETVNGVEMPPPAVPEHLKDVPLVSDMSSNILSRPIPWSSNNFGIVYAGAQKNIGPSGVTLVIVRKDLLVDMDQAVPLGGPRASAMISYKNHADNDSCYNTPPMFPIYISGLVFQHLLATGGVAAMEQTNIQKAQLIYNVIDASNGFYIAKSAPNCRSRMNIVFVLKGGESQEAQFVKAAEQDGFKQVKGHRFALQHLNQRLNTESWSHRSVGGIRTSLYNAITLEQTQKLADFVSGQVLSDRFTLKFAQMTYFQKQHE